MSPIRTRHDKTTLLVTKGDNEHFRTLRAITYKKILNKSNAILAACLRLLVTFGLESRAFARKKKIPPAPPHPSPTYIQTLALANNLKAKNALEPLHEILSFLMPRFWTVLYNLGEK